ncbi:FG-GAP repeat protein [Haladaptatus caseinilyticus]|uniref:FG-GAP repeat protein n=1 Tax=Haladaptatus caseinilyticus TaxID=2993314 RepID=UPI00224A8AC1|nr:FG-GAP repeat protein [Haladaptatus caseinilyticus]
MRSRDNQHETAPLTNADKSESRIPVDRRSFFAGLCGAVSLGLGGVAGGKNSTTPAGQLKTSNTRDSLETDVEEQLVKLVPTDNAEDDRFGYSVSLDSDGETALIGAFNNDDNGEDSGAAYIFTQMNSEWSQTAKLTADDADERDIFGWSVALDDDGKTALVTANGRNTDSAYLFTKADNRWNQTAKLTVDEDNPVYAFGLSVAFACNGKTVLIGASIGDPDGGYSGAAYMFKKTNTGWSQTAKLTADDETNHDSFGGSVALDNDGRTALIGDYRDDENRSNSGAAYIFAKDCDEWIQTAKLTAGDCDYVVAFGRSVALDCGGKTAIIGASVDDNHESSERSPAYIFTQTDEGWRKITTLTADDGDPGDSFGSSVALDDRGETALIGASEDDDNGAVSGSAYIFAKRNDEWSQMTKLIADDGDENDRFGLSVALDSGGETALIGASFDENGFEWTHAGSAYIYEE